MLSSGPVSSGAVTRGGSAFKRRVLRKMVPEAVRRRVARSYRPLFLRGTDVACPICGSEFRRFLNHRGQPSVRCPRCGSMERHRLLWLWLQRETNFFSDRLTVLHFAPEWGLKEHLLNFPNLEYRTTDLDSPLADEHFDITAIPYAEQTVDVIFCNHVLEHIPDDRKAMSELHRILRPGGWALVMTPLSPKMETTLEGIQDPDQRLAEYGQEDHVRLYGTDFYDRLREAGFRVEVVDYAAALPGDIVSRDRLRRQHPVFEDDKIIVAHKAPTLFEASGT